MKSMIVLILICFSVGVTAQVKQSNIPAKKKSSSDSARYLSKKKTSTTFSKTDTIKIAIPKDNSFNPSNAKLKNSKIKTPVYDNNLTGTNAPGDRNTGLNVDNRAHHAEVNPALEKVKAIKDSTYNSTKPN